MSTSWAHRSSPRDPARVLPAGLLLGVLPAQPCTLTARVLESRPVAGTHRFRRLRFGGAVFLAAILALPPVSSLALRYEFVAALQFAAYAMAVPALLVLGAASYTKGFSAHCQDVGRGARAA